MLWKKILRNPNLSSKFKAFWKIAVFRKPLTCLPSSLWKILQANSSPCVAWCIFLLRSTKHLYSITRPLCRSTLKTPNGRKCSAGPSLIPMQPYRNLYRIFIFSSGRPYWLPLVFPKGPYPNPCLLVLHRRGGTASACGLAMYPL